ncbi:MAG: glutamate racemase [Cyclobacteriaceae bacterium]|nr:glutamate racemase [Cyclobacteriaceae bacterium SS2]
MAEKGPIGVFDSGYGGLTVLKSLVEKLPNHEFLYLGDNARTPYGTRSFETIYRYTLQSVKYLFSQGCPLIIVACNTASAKALRNIQQKDLPTIAPDRRVLGVLRPTTETIGNQTSTGHIGILGTRGTIQSESYLIEIKKFFPHLKVSQEICPMWVPLVENGEQDGPGADYFVQKNLNHILKADDKIDTLLLACTHYPLLIPKIKQFLPPNIKIIDQGKIVADSLFDYLNRHPEIEEKLRKSGSVKFLTTDDENAFNEKATLFYGKKTITEKTDLNIR